MAKQLKDIIKKAKSDSKLVPNRVSDMLKPGDEKKFASKHLIQKHADRNGNDKGVFDGGDVHYDLNFSDEKRHGRKKGEDEKVYEAVEKENTKCNESAKGTMCEVHGMNDCKKVKPLTEKDEDKPPFEGPYDTDQKAKDKNVAKNAARKAMKQMTKEEAEPDDGDDIVSIIKDTRSKMDATNDPSEKERYKKRHDLLRSLPNRVPETPSSSNKDLTSSYDGAYGLSEVNLDKHYKSWMSSPDAPRDDHSGDYDKVSSLAKRYLNGSGVPEKDHDDVADKLTSKFHGESYEHVNEVLTKKTPTAEWIKDFVDSDNPKFEGKSKKKRTQMALAAYYSKQDEKKN